MEIPSPLYANFSFGSICLASAVTAICFLCVLWAFRSSPGGKRSKSRPGKSDGGSSKKSCGCSCYCSAPGGSSSLACANGSAGEKYEKESMLGSSAGVEKQTGGSMMEQLVPEITTHALSYLDYPSLCRLSMTNSWMRKAANDDNAWKALYHKDFTVEQDTVTPHSGWKAYYAATKAIVNINMEFFNIIKERSLVAMGRLWLQADYVKCIHGTGELFAGYNAVMESWALAFNWGQGVAFQVRDVRARVLPDMAWVTMKVYVDMEPGPSHVTNVYEFHNGQWYLVHHHRSLMLMDGEGDHNIFG
ncbi:F-box protein SKIP8-like [Aristolochia californica]|uniref:F-box protein SKIP8-like n=1 Tax=Aristolochia californica TaxID=171875 RepID=UPI0035DD7E23